MTLPMEFVGLPTASDVTRASRSTKRMSEAS